jgi:hypothetical protein
VLIFLHRWDRVIRQFHLPVYQRLLHLKPFAGHKFWLCFLHLWTCFTYLISLPLVVVFSGETGYNEYTLNFRPVDVWIDRNEQLLDASIKQTQTFTCSGDFDYTLCDLKVSIINVNDSVTIKVSHNWVSPDELGEGFDDFILSTSHYWRVNILSPGPVEVTGQFDYSRTLHDTLLREFDEDSLVLLYRSDKALNWQIVSDNAIGSGFSGYLQDDSLKSGEYCFAFRIRTTGKIKQQYKKNKSYLEIYPNPAHNYINIKSNYPQKSKIKIVNIYGKVLWEKTIEKGHIIKYNLTDEKNTLLVILQNKNKRISEQKLIIGNKN